jgi:hypothetical protein
VGTGEVGMDGNFKHGPLPFKKISNIKCQVDTECQSDFHLNFEL